MGSTYSYDGLKDPKSDLRLVTIESGFQGDARKCTIKQHSGIHVPEYKALSYVWGESTHEIPISLNGHIFYVTLNLESALRNLRRSMLEERDGQEDYFWIDAMCIDQDNIDERDEQVRRMKSIYQDARVVVIYLGDYEDPHDAALRSNLGQWGLQELPHCDPSVSWRIQAILYGFAELNSKLKDINRRKEIIDSSSEILATYLGADVEHWVQIARLLHRPWFERLWVIQELGASRHAVVQFGRTVVDWQHLEITSSYILRPPDGLQIPNKIRRILPLIGAHRLAQVALNSVRDVDKGNILTALWHTRSANCSDPRDRLYAILGVVDDDKDIQIDYASPVETVYTKWATNRINRTKGLDILSLCADSNGRGLPSSWNSSRDIPSWVPDLRRPWGHDKFLWNWAMQNSTFKKLPGERLFSFSKDGSTLTVHGHYLARITAVTGVGNVTSYVEDLTNINPRLQTIIAEWEEWALEQRPSTISNDPASSDMQKIVYETALLRGGFKSFNESEYQTATRYRIWRRIAGIIGSSTANNHDLPRDKEIVGNLEGQLFSMVHGHQVFATAGGNLGMVAGNCEARVGDQLWVLLGGLTPFILRAGEFLDGGYRLITPCYFLNHLMPEKYAAIAGPLQRVTLH